LRLSDGTICFSVHDDGIGIDKAKQQDVFKQYERAVEHTNISGLGLGLYISSKIIEAHHGHINVESEKNKGSTFTVDLPAA
jgi:signal transduction histidine kinase